MSVKAKGTSAVVFASLAVMSALCRPSAAQAQVFSRHGLRTVLVGAIPGDPVASGARLLNALASINPATCPGDNWKLWIAPGVYDLGRASLVMKPCVDVEGAGERATTITAAGGDCRAATVIAASNTELRLLTVESTSFTSCAFHADGANTKLIQVTLRATDARTANSYVLSADNASLLSLTHVTIASSGQFKSVAITASHSSLTLIEVSVVASGGIGCWAVVADSSTLIIRRSRLAAPEGCDGVAIGSYGGLIARVAHSQLEGGLEPGIACIGNYDADFAQVTCP